MFPGKPRPKRECSVSVGEASRVRTPDRFVIGGGVALSVGVAMAYRTTQENSILGNHDRLLVEIMVWWLTFAVALICPVSYTHLTLPTKRIV